MNQRLDFHLNDEQMTQCLMGESTAQFAAHLAECSACRAEAGALSGTISGFRSALDAATPRLVRWERVSEPSDRWAISKLRWATAVAALLVLGTVLLTRAPNPEPAKSREAADEALLVQIQTDIGRYVPQALSPVQRIADERTTILVARSKHSQNSNRRINQ